MQDLIIHIHKATEERGYFYDIYESEDDFDNGKSADGGLCSTTIKNTLDMANAQALDLVKQKRKQKAKQGVDLCKHDDFRDTLTGRICSDCEK